MISYAGINFNRDFRKCNPPKPHSDSQFVISGRSRKGAAVLYFLRFLLQGLVFLLGGQASILSQSIAYITPFKTELRTMFSDFGSGTSLRAVRVQ